ncbi:hypothetical protein RRG08_040908 [Elysia crispata]|uniref:Uncharacterized protein n=1 Tax=Elysia crispata TaxID=231223 RepID=A0AAE0ZRK8_9GAST|nr:hypothetical protein RRG08_040908 [Elysia crispata]
MTGAAGKIWHRRRVAGIAPLVSGTRGTERGRALLQSPRYRHVIAVRAGVGGGHSHQPRSTASTASS